MRGNAAEVAQKAAQIKEWVLTHPGETGIYQKIQLAFNASPKFIKKVLADMEDHIEQVRTHTDLSAEQQSRASQTVCDIRINNSEQEMVEECQSNALANALAERDNLQHQLDELEQRYREQIVVTQAALNSQRIFENQLVAIQKYINERLPAYTVKSTVTRVLNDIQTITDNQQLL